MRKPIQAKYLASFIHALLFLAMWGLNWAFAQPLANGPAASPFWLLFIADFPISFVAFGVLFTSVKFGLLAAMLWGVVGTLWWYLIGWFIDAGIRSFRSTDYGITEKSVPTGNSLRDNLSTEPLGNTVFWKQWREWLVAGAAVAVLVLISLAWSWNGPKGGVQSGSIALGTFAPDGRSVLLSRSQGNSSFLYKIALDTGKSIRLTRASSGIENSPAYSPDAEHVVFLYTVSQNERPRIFIMSTNDDSAHALFVSQSNVDDFSPTFAADGKRVYFGRTESSSNGSTSRPSTLQRWDIYSADLRGEDLRKLTDRHFQQFSTLSISNDGKKMLYSTGGESGSELRLYSLEKPSEPEKNLQPYVPHEGRSPLYSGASISPDGRDVYFLAASSQGDKAFDYDVYRLELATNSAEKLTSANGYATDLCVSPDGTRAIFLRWTSRWGSLPNISKLYLLNLDTKTLRAVNVTGTQ